MILDFSVDILYFFMISKKYVFDVLIIFSCIIFSSLHEGYKIIYIIKKPPLRGHLDDINGVFLQLFLYHLYTL
jgi:hypothetical protein